MESQISQKTIEDEILKIMKLAGIRIIRPGRNDLKVVRYFVVIPLRPLRRRSFTI